MPNLTPEEKAVIKKLQATQPDDVTLFDLLAENAKLWDGMVHILDLMESNDLDHAHAALQLMLGAPTSSKAWELALKMGVSDD